MTETIDKYMSRLLKPLIDELNEIIEGEPEYTHGSFRFRPILGSDGYIRVMIANSKWHKRFYKSFQFSGLRYGIGLEYSEWDGMYKLYPIEGEGAVWLNHISTRWEDEKKKYKRRSTWTIQ